MKKILSLFISILLALLTLAACSQHGPESESSASESEPPQPVTLQICVDLPFTYSQTISDFFQAFPGVGSDFEILIETIPDEGTERENALKRIRTEILAGKGPDILLCTSDLPYYHHDPLFPLPRQTMENNIFLPLDEYIEQAQYLEWNKLLPQVMEAGRNDAGQLLLPVTYNMQMFLLEKTGPSLAFEYPAAWEALAESGDTDAQMVAGSTAFFNILGEFSDYEKDTLTLTEDELFYYSQRHVMSLKACQESSSNMTGTHLQDGRFTIPTETGSQAVDLRTEGSDFWILAGCNLDGGITANIVHFAGINSNTAHPDQAFQVLDYLLSERGQTSSLLFEQYLPVHMNLYSEDHARHGNYMNQWNFQQFTKLREEINVAKFYTPLDKAVNDAYSVISDEDELRDLVHKQYVLMQMLLAES